MINRWAGSLLAVLFLVNCSYEIKAQTPAPEDFRAVWFTTVSGLDWPAGTTNINTQRQRILSELDASQAAGANAIIMQVRTECDAYFVSDKEPWARWLTGTQGNAPARLWDPLQFMIDECRRRGLEIHAWFNPYRAGVNNVSSFSANHVTNTNPTIVETYRTYYWLNPGHPDTIPYSVGVVMDVVDRYDIDGIHFDDYFYPYSIDVNNPFPDTDEYNAYVSDGGTMSLGDWRRDNVNRFIEAIDDALAARPAKGNVRYGISPFGIWRPGNPAGIVGLDAYASIFADSRKWLQEGWVDYFTPQIYWGMAEDGHSSGQDFDSLLDWWTNSTQNPHGRPIFPGLPTYKIPTGIWQASHVLNQVNYVKNSSSAKGTVHFRTQHITKNSGTGEGGITTLLTADSWTEAGVLPAYPHMDSTPPSEPTLAWENASGGGYNVYWTPAGSEYPQWYVLYVYDGSTWSHSVLPDWQQMAYVPAGSVSIAIEALDRSANRSTMSAQLLSGTSPPIPNQLESINICNHDSDSFDFFTGSGSNRFVTPSADVATNNEYNNRVDPSVGSMGNTSRHIPFNWTQATEGFYRLSTFGPNPQVDLSKGLGVYVKLLSGELDVAVGIRETGGSGPIGANGGVSGGIELTEIQRLKASANWQYLYFNMPDENYTSFASGNGQLDGSWGVFEGLFLYQVPGAGTAFNLYIDEIHQGDAHTPLGEPIRPRKLELHPEGAGSIGLTWEASPMQDIKGYRIYRSTSPNVAAAPENLVAETTSAAYHDTSTIPHTGYYYVVTTVDHFGYESPVSGEVSINSAPVAVSGFEIE